MFDTRIYNIIECRACEDRITRNTPCIIVDLIHGAEDEEDLKDILCPYIKDRKTAWRVLNGYAFCKVNLVEVSEVPR